MIYDIDLFQLPCVSLSQVKELPNCSSIYFVIDSQNRFLYIGKCQNLLNRWKNHHRFDQLQEINKENSIRIAWLVWNKSNLSTVEKHFIDFYQPLLNQTDIKSKQTIPSEITLRELLDKIRSLTIAIGFEASFKNQTTTVYLKYDYENSGKNGCAVTIKNFKQETKNKPTNLKIKRTKYGEYRTHNTRPGSKEHKMVSRIKSSYNNHWTINCNGIVTDITPLNNYDFKLLRNKNNSSLQKLGGIKIRAINNFQVFNECRSRESLKNKYLSLEIIKHDLIPLFWLNEDK